MGERAGHNSVCMCVLDMGKAGRPSKERKQNINLLPLALSSQPRHRKKACLSMQPTNGLLAFADSSQSHITSIHQAYPPLSSSTALAGAALCRRLAVRLRAAVGHWV